MNFPLAALVLGYLLLAGSDPKRTTNTETIIKSELQMRAEVIKRSKLTMAEKGKRLVEFIKPGMAAREVQRLLGKPTCASLHFGFVYYDYREYQIHVTFVSDDPQYFSDVPSARGVISVQYANEPPRRKHW